MNINMCFTRVLVKANLCCQWQKTAFPPLLLWQPALKSGSRFLETDLQKRCISMRNRNEMQSAPPQYWINVVAPHSSFLHFFVFKKQWTHVLKITMKHAVIFRILSKIGGVSQLTHNCVFSACFLAPLHAQLLLLSGWVGGRQPEEVHLSRRVPPAHLDRHLCLPKDLEVVYAWNICEAHKCASGRIVLTFTPQNPAKLLWAGAFRVLCSALMSFSSTKNPKCCQLSPSCSYLVRPLFQPLSIFIYRLSLNIVIHLFFPDYACSSQISSPRIGLLYLIQLNKHCRAATITLLNKSFQ